MQSEKSYFITFLKNCVVYGFGSIFLGIPWLFWGTLEADTPIYSFIILGIFLAVVAWGTNQEVAEDIKRDFKTQLDLKNHEVEELEKHRAKAEYNEALWKASLKERTSGFPTLFKHVAYYEQLQDEHLSNYLRTKSHPALTSAETVQKEAKRRREAEFIQRTTQGIIEYYENIAPFLLDFKEQELDETDEALKEYSEEEREDPVTNYLTKEEYRKLSSTERNQMALERYWKRPKSKWLIGRIYERYVGYLYEVKGYEVDYVGIFKGYEDLGRDLICTKGKEVIIIQCKNWSQFKTIFEKHIFQFFGTVFQYKDEFKNKSVQAIFYTTTELSELARRFAKELKIDLEEKFKMNQDYACVKCNVSPDGTKIYHLPFDQQYDNTKIEIHKGEFYAKTIKEAESKGFRRAYRWRGPSTA